MRKVNWFGCGPSDFVNRANVRLSLTVEICLAVYGETSSKVLKTEGGQTQ